MNINNIHLNRGRLGGDDGAGICGCLVFLVIVGIFAGMPTGTLPSFFKLFIIIFIGLNVLILWLESLADMSQRIRNSAGETKKIKISDEKCLEFIDFLKMLVEMRPTKFVRDFTRKTAINLGGNLKEFEALFARLIILEEVIENSFEEINLLDSFCNEIKQIKNNLKNTTNKETRESLHERERIIEAKVAQIKQLQSTKNQYKQRRLLILDIIKELKLKLRNMDIKIDNDSDNLESDLRQELNITREEMQIIESVAARCFSENREA